MFCKFLSDNSYSAAVRSAAARLLLSCYSAWTVSFSLSVNTLSSLHFLSSPTRTIPTFHFSFWSLQPQYPHAFEDAIVENIKKWVTEDGGASNECESKHLGKNNKPTDADMLRTYAIGLLAMALCG